VELVSVELEVPGHAFLSYVREDSAAVDRLERVLRAAGISVWRNTDLNPGDDWRSRIREAITQDALAFIACFSASSASREVSYQREELTLAIEQIRLRRPGIAWLLPVRLDDCVIPDLHIGCGRTLASIQHADLFGAEREEGLARLIATVLHILDGRPTPAPRRQPFLTRPRALRRKSAPGTSCRLASTLYPMTVVTGCA
jgi:hypothetical protein